MRRQAFGVVLLGVMGGCGEAIVDPVLDLSMPDLQQAPTKDLSPQADLLLYCMNTGDCMGLGNACCKNRCANLDSDPLNCGGCGLSCAGPGMTCCAGRCIDTRNDIANCGMCGMTCQVANGTPTCRNGACAVGMCNAGFADCSGPVADGCETPIDNNPMNCGACNNACDFANAQSACVAGMCKLTACKVGFSDCNADGKDGCEVSTLADPRNCGACGAECLTRPNAQVKCAASACQIQSCNGTFLDCDKDPFSGCEIDGATNVKNCGACGNACPANTVCKAGMCDCPPCVFPSARASCQNLACVIDSCFANTADCDKIVQNGCEAQLQTDTRNCGACGVVCGPQTPACVAGVCTKIYLSCKDILAGVPGSKDGPYLIDPDGGGPIPVTQVYCDMTTSGGGWTIVYASAGIDGDVGMVSDATILGNALNYDAYNLSRAVKMSLSALSTESLFKRKSDSAWLRASAPLFDNNLDGPMQHMHRQVNLTASNGATAQGAIGYSNYNTTGGGDYGVSMFPDGATCQGNTITGFDHHAATYWHLNCGCQRQYLYSYSNNVADGDQAYNINTGLGSWTATQSCATIEGGGLVFWAAMR